MAGEESPVLLVNWTWSRVTELEGKRKKSEGTMLEVKSVGYYDWLKIGPRKRQQWCKHISKKCWVTTRAFETQWMTLLMRNRKSKTRKYFYAQRWCCRVGESILCLKWEAETEIPSWTKCILCELIFLRWNLSCRLVKCIICNRYGSSYSIVDALRNLFGIESLDWKGTSP